MTYIINIDIAISRIKIELLTTQTTIWICRCYPNSPTSSLWTDSIKKILLYGGVGLTLVDYIAHLHQIGETAMDQGK